MKIDINQKLLIAAIQIGEFSTKEEAINTALKEFIERRKRKEVMKMFGKVDYDSGYDYKRSRRI